MFVKCLKQGFALDLIDLISHGANVHLDVLIDHLEVVSAVSKQGWQLAKEQLEERLLSNLNESSTGEHAQFCVAAEAHHIVH